MSKHLKQLRSEIKKQQILVADARDALRDAIIEAEGIADDFENASDDLLNALEYINGAIDTLSQQQ